MGIQNFPVSLQPIIQQGFLEREFSQALRSRLGYRACADRVSVAVGIGETLTKTRAGLKPSVTTPLAPATNTNFDNGLSPTSWGVEQYTISINLYAVLSLLAPYMIGVRGYQWWQGGLVFGPAVLAMFAVLVADVAHAAAARVDFVPDAVGQWQEGLMAAGCLAIDDHLLAAGLIDKRQRKVTPAVAVVVAYRAEAL